MSLKWFLKTKIKFEDFHGQYKFCLSAITRLDVIQVLLELSVLFLKRALLVVHKHTTKRDVNGLLRRRNPTAVRYRKRKRAQRCDSSSSDSAETTMCTLV